MCLPKAKFTLDFLGSDRKVKHCMVTYPLFTLFVLLTNNCGGEFGGVFSIPAVPFAE